MFSFSFRSAFSQSGASLVSTRCFSFKYLFILSFFSNALTLCEFTISFFMCLAYLCEFIAIKIFRHNRALGVPWWKVSAIRLINIDTRVKKYPTTDNVLSCMICHVSLDCDKSESVHMFQSFVCVFLIFPNQSFLGRSLFEFATRFLSRNS